VPQADIVHSLVKIHLFQFSCQMFYRFLVISLPATLIQQTVYGITKGVH